MNLTKLLYESLFNPLGRSPLRDFGRHIKVKPGGEPRPWLSLTMLEGQLRSYISLAVPSVRGKKSAIGNDAIETSTPVVAEVESP